MTRPNIISHTFLDKDNILWEVCTGKEYEFVTIMSYPDGDDEAPVSTLIPVKDLDKLMLGLSIAKRYHEFAAAKKGKNGNKAKAAKGKEATRRAVKGS